MCHADADVRKSLAAAPWRPGRCPRSGCTDKTLAHSRASSRWMISRIMSHVALDHIRLHRMAVAGRRVQLRERTDAHQRHLQGPRDRRCAQREHIDAVLQFLDAFFMFHAKALFLIDDQKAQILPYDILGQQAVCTDDDVDASLFQSFDDPWSGPLCETKRLRTSMRTG